MEKPIRPHIFIIQDKDGNNFIVNRITENDGWRICDLMTANENRFLPFFPKTLEANLTPDLSNRFVQIKSKEFDQKEEFLFTVKPVDSRKVIGLIYIKELDWEKKQGELAYCIDYNYEGKGITTQIINKLSEYAFQELDLEVLQIHVHKSNISSVKVAEKANFTWIKTLSKSFTPPGKEPVDMELYERYHS